MMHEDNQKLNLESLHLLMLELLTSLAYQPPNSNSNYPQILNF